MIWRHSLILFSTLKKEAAISPETVVTSYHSEQCQFPVHSNLPELGCFHITRISWLILRASSSSSSSPPPPSPPPPSLFIKSEALIVLFHKACHFNSIATFKPHLSKFHFNTVLQLTPADLHSENSEPTLSYEFLILSTCAHVLCV